MAGGMDLKAELDGKKALAKLERVLRATDKPQVFLKDIGEYLLRAHFDRFAKKKSPAGGAWKKLNEKYKKRKPKHKNLILVPDSRLKGEMAYQVIGDELHPGSNTVYARTHQLGDDSRGIPARPFLGLSLKDKVEVKGIAQMWLMDLFR